MSIPNKQLVFLTAQIAVSPMLTPKRLRLAKALGIASVISAVPEPQDRDTDSAAHVRLCRMEYRSVSGTATDAATTSHFRKTLAELPKPVLVFCQTGERAVTLWASAMIGVMPGNDIVAAAARAGFDVAGLIDEPGASTKRAA